MKALPMRGSKLPSLLALASLTALGLASNAHAELIDVQFPGNFSYACGNTTACSSPTQTGAAFVGSAGDVWNALPAASGTSALVNATGAASAISLTYSTGSTPGTYVDGNNPNNFSGTPYANLYGGYLYGSGGGGITLTLSGLTAGQAFTLYTYTEQDGRNQAGRSMNVDVNGFDQVDTQSGAGTFIAGDTYLMFTGNADATGKVNIAISTLNGESDLNGLQLQTVAAQSATPIPEPASLLLLGIPAALVLRRRTAGAA